MFQGYSDCFFVPCLLLHLYISYYMIKCFYSNVSCYIAELKILCIYGKIYAICENDHFITF